MKKSKLSELDVVRALAILAVVIIHSTSSGSVVLPQGGFPQLFFLWVNKLSNFAVPVFLALSGLVLFYRYQGDWSGRGALQFYLKRVKQIVIPYLIWSMIYYVYEGWLLGLFYPTWWNWSFNLTDWLNLLPYGDAKYHLYFLVIIAQFYLVFPLLMSLVNRFAWIGKWLFAIGVIIQLAHYLHQRIDPVDHYHLWCLSYFAYFTFGGWIGLYYDQLKAWFSRYIAVVLAVFAVSGIAFAGMFHLTQKGQKFEGYQFELSLFFYCLTALVVLIWASEWIQKKLSGVTKVLYSLGNVSFGIYLMHPLVLTTWNLNYLENSGGTVLRYVMMTGLGFVATLGIPWLLMLGYRQFQKWQRQQKKRA